MSDKMRQRILLASPISWAVYFTAVYLLVEAACNIGLWRNAAATIILVLMVPTLIITAGVTYQSWQATQNREPVADPSGEVNHEDTNYFIGQVGVWLNLLFVILTIGVGVTAFALQPC